MDRDFLERLCRCLAISTVEVEITLKHMVPEPCEELVEVAAMSRALIAEAGFDFDTLYPVADHPVTQEQEPPADLGCDFCRGT